MIPSSRLNSPMLTHLSANMHATGWRRVIGCLIFIGHFPQKSPITSGSFASGCFAKNDLQLFSTHRRHPMGLRHRE